MNLSWRESDEIAYPLKCRPAVPEEKGAMYYNVPLDRMLDAQQMRAAPSRQHKSGRQ